MKIIKIMYCNFWNGFDIYTSLIYTFLKTKFDITLTNNDPDLIIFSNFDDTDEKRKLCKKYNIEYTVLDRENYYSNILPSRSSTKIKEELKQ